MLRLSPEHPGRGVKGCGCRAGTEGREKGRQLNDDDVLLVQRLRKLRRILRFVYYPRGGQRLGGGAFTGGRGITID